MIVIPIFTARKRSDGASLPGPGAADVAAPPPAPETPSPAPETPSPEECPPPVVERQERRTGTAKEASIACRSCGVPLGLDAAPIRLTVSHALLRCNACGAELRVRRNDAFRHAEGQVAWGFASYAAETTDEADEPETNRRRGPLASLFRRGEQS